MNFTFFSGADPTHYKIFYKKNAEKDWASVYVHYLTHAIVKDLTADTKYEFYVVAFNGGFSGPRSRIVNLRTPAKSKLVRLSYNYCTDFIFQRRRTHGAAGKTAPSPFFCGG